MNSRKIEQAERAFEMNRDQLNSFIQTHFFAQVGFLPRVNPWYNQYLFLVGSGCRELQHRGTIPSHLDLDIVCTSEAVFRGCLLRLLYSRPDVRIKYLGGFSFTLGDRSVDFWFVPCMDQYIEKVPITVQRNYYRLDGLEEVMHRPHIFQGKAYAGINNKETANLRREYTVKKLKLLATAGYKLTTEAERFLNNPKALTEEIDTTTLINEIMSRLSAQQQSNKRDLELILLRDANLKRREEQLNVPLAIWSFFNWVNTFKMPLSKDDPQLRRFQLLEL